jgi:signal peptidase I
MGCLDAFRLAKETDTEEMQAGRRTGGKPWAAVLLSILLPGLGHAYLRKWGLFVLYLLGSLALSVLPEYGAYTVIAVLVFRTLAWAHAYVEFGIHTKQEKKVLMGFAIVFLAVNALSEVLIPMVKVKYIAEMSLHGWSRSMEPTIKQGDWVVISKCAYARSNPEVGDIIVFEPPDSVKLPPIVENRRLTGLCKRVAAVGGETIQLKGDKIYVNGKQRRLIASPELMANPSLVDEKRNGTVHWAPYRRFAVVEPYEIPVGHYFVLGDNTGSSTDSRDFGAIPENQIAGRVVKIVWPIRRIGRL